MSRRQITFRQLETFATVARLRSHTRAAERLHLTQPAVSIQLKKLTDSIGHPLFEARGREVALTPVGSDLLAAVTAIDDAWNRFAEAVEDHHQLRRGMLRVATVTTAKYFLPRMLGHFCHSYPGVDVELEVLNRERIIARLRDGLDDLYVMGIPPDDLPVEAHPFLDNALVVIAPADWRAPRRGTLTLGDLAKERFILRESGSGTRRLIDNHIATLGYKLNIRLVLGSNEAIRESVAGGMGLAILSRHALHGDPSASGVRELKVSGFPLHGQWYVVYRSDRPLTRPAASFLDTLLNAGHAPT